MTDTERTTHGGTRAGAGRPALDPSGTTPIALRLPARQLEIIDRLAADEGKNRSEMIRDMLTDALREWGQWPEEYEQIRPSD